MISTRLFVLAPMYGFLAVCGGLLAYMVGPDVEERFWPVLTDQVIERTWPAPKDDGLIRAGDACFLWTYTKARDATLIKQESAVVRDGIHYPVTRIRIDLGIPTNNSTTAKPGTRRPTPECVATPTKLRADPRFTIEGRNTYLPWHHLWTIEQPLVLIDYDGTRPGTSVTTGP